MVESLKTWFRRIAALLVHLTFLLYCIWQHKHDNAKFIWSRSHLPEFLPVLHLDFDFKTLDYNFGSALYFFIKFSNYIAYYNMDIIMPSSLGQGHMYQSFAPFCIWMFFPDQVSEGDTSV